MKFSIKVQYGLQAILELALNYEGGDVQIGEIARSQGIPVRFLEQLLLILKKRGVLASTRGKHGGYSLAKHPSDISLLEVIEAMEGQIELTAKKMKKMPVLHEALENIQNKFRESLKELSVEDLVIKKRQRDRAYIYNI